MTDHLFTDSVLLSQDCSICSKPFSFPKPERGRYPVFCSDVCRNEGNRRSKIKNGRKRSEHPIIKCDWCPNLFQKYDHAKFCSEECRKESRLNKRRASGDWGSGQHRTITKSCLACDTSFIVKTDNGKFLCGEVCQKDWFRIQRRVWFVRYRRAKKPFRIPPLPRICLDCEQRAVARYKKYCVKCSEDRRISNRIKAKIRYRESGLKAAYTALRKARIRAVTTELVNPITVLIRDQWTCQSCFVHTPRRLRGTYEMNAPEIDHIIPLSKGGAHSYANVQCLCRSCNFDKSDRLDYMDDDTT